MPKLLAGAFDTGGATVVECAVREVGAAVPGAGAAASEVPIVLTVTPAASTAAASTAPERRRVRISVVGTGPPQIAPGEGSVSTGDGGRLGWSICPRYGTTGSDERHASLTQASRTQGKAGHLARATRRERGLPSPVSEGGGVQDVAVERGRVGRLPDGSHRAVRPHNPPPLTLYRFSDEGLRQPAVHALKAALDEAA